MWRARLAIFRMELALFRRPLRGWAYVAPILVVLCVAVLFFSLGQALCDTDADILSLPIQVLPPPPSRRAVQPPACVVDPQQLDKNGDGRVTLNEVFDRVFYLNPDGAQARRDIVRATLEPLGIIAERFPQLSLADPAVKEPYDEYTRRSLNAFEKRMRRGKLIKPTPFAVLKTMERLIHTARSRGYRRVLVLEDGVILHREFVREFDRKIRLLPPKWRLLYLGASQFMWDDTAMEWDETIGDGREFYHPLLTDGAFAVGIDESVFDILLFEISKMLAPFDAGPLRAVLVPFQRESYVFFPNLVARDLSSQSAGTRTKASKVEDDLRWNMTTYTPRPSPAMLPKVCVVVTYKNAAETIEYSLKSLLSQSYTNIEVVVIDDASTDNSSAIVNRLASKDERVLFFRNEHNKGTYASRNAGLVWCTGEIYMNHDADDVSLPDRVATQVIPIIERRAEITASLFIRAHTTIEDFKVDPVEVLARANKARVHRTTNDYQYCCKEKLGLMTTMMRMSVFERIGRFDPTRFSGDAEILERYFAVVLGRFITSGSFNIHTYLWQLAPPGSLMPHFVLIPRTLLVAADIKSSLTHSVPIFGDERTDYERDYRKRLIGAANVKAVGYNPFY